MADPVRDEYLIVVRSGIRRLISWLRRRQRASESPSEGPRQIDVRIPSGLFFDVRRHVEDFSRGEEAGFLLCALSRLPDRDVLLAREWIPIPDRAISRNAHGSVLAWSAAFNSEVVQRALDEGMTAVLVHSHGSPQPDFSPDDRQKERPLFGAFSRLLDPLPTGSLLLGKGDTAGSFWQRGKNDLVFRRLVVVGEPIDTWLATDARPARPPRRRLNRQNVAIGPDSDPKLAATTVAVVGVSGGGSHVVQQLAHQGFGALMPVDDEIVDESNLGRLVGATARDVGVTPKTRIARRVAEGVDPGIEVTEVSERFPSEASIEKLKSADVIVSCVDTFRAREALNAFCRRYLIPFVDIGIAIRSSGETLASADGQLIVSLPGRPCMRCWFISDAVLERERTERPPGYDQNPDAPGDPQVVSMNGVLASEACNCVLDLITGYSGGRRAGKFWQYEGKSGTLTPSDLPTARPGCPACVEEGLGDPAELQ